MPKLAKSDRKVVKVSLTEEARELTTEQRQQEENLEKNMLERSGENLAGTSS
jgi:DNA-binding MarR family transcriptional regulator